MKRCFVIQPFDGAVFDRRFDDVVAPAVRDADLEPYRVDRDHNVEVPINDIESGIRSARVCLAEITTDNPNVWFELGYAIASQKDVVLICSDERATRFPFDIQHRRVITYSTGSPSDFGKLRADITGRLKAILSKQPLADLITNPIGPTEGLQPHEFALLATVMQNLLDPDDCVASWTIRDEMEKAGYTKMAISIGLRSLAAKGMISTLTRTDMDGDLVSGYTVTNEGELWLMNNLEKLSLKKPTEKYDFEPDDDLPF